LGPPRFEKGRRKRKKRKKRAEIPAGAVKMGSASDPRIMMKEGG